MHGDVETPATRRRSGLEGQMKQSFWDILLHQVNNQHARTEELNRAADGPQVGVQLQAPGYPTRKRQVGKARRHAESSEACRLRHH